MIPSLPPNDESGLGDLLTDGNPVRNVPRVLRQSANRSRSWVLYQEFLISIVS